MGSDRSAHATASIPGGEGENLPHEASEVLATLTRAGLAATDTDNADTATAVDPQDADA